ncbi:hypothetical protein BKA64DRAFT_53419 [Cadophora sp. MPI-SDFR-AT-0126]|nr:hypothetical protein BKA64DRAFT_53419 [Leotiomycetes sp. MPI-SDFR-AT-0126]
MVPIFDVRGPDYFGSEPWGRFVSHVNARERRGICRWSQLRREKDVLFICVLNWRVSTFNRCQEKLRIQRLYQPSKDHITSHHLKKTRQTNRAVSNCSSHAQTRKAFCLGIPRPARESNLRTTTSSHSRRPFLSFLPQISTSSTFHHQQLPFCGHASSTRSLSIRPSCSPGLPAASFRGPPDRLCSIYSWPRLALQAAASLTFRHPPAVLLCRPRPRPRLLLSLHSDRAR